MNIELLIVIGVVALTASALGWRAVRTVRRQLNDEGPGCGGACSGGDCGPGQEPQGRKGRLPVIGAE
jgi:hypothetical protein